MPLYDYSCKECGGVSERLVSIANRLKPEGDPCEQCGGEMKLSIQGKFLPTLEKDFQPPKDFGKFLSKLKKNTKGAGDFRT